MPGWRITHVVETHVQNDYLVGRAQRRAARRAEIVAPARGRYAFEHRGADAGDTVEVGGLRLVARVTPGHTREHLAWEVRRTERTARPPCSTGGSLLVGKCRGRTDLLGADATDELTRAQFTSLRGAREPAGRRGGAHRSSPTAVLLGRSHRWRSDLDHRHGAADEPAVGGTGRGGVPRGAAGRARGPIRTYYEAMAPINRAGPPAPGRPAAPGRLDAAGFAAAVAAGAHVVDGRPRAEFAAGHAPGSTNIELTESFASYVGRSSCCSANRGVCAARAARGGARGGGRPVVPHRLRPGGGRARRRPGGGGRLRIAVEVIRRRRSRRSRCRCHRRPQCLRARRQGSGRMARGRCRARGDPDPVGDLPDHLAFDPP